MRFILISLLVFSLSAIAEKQEVKTPAPKKQVTTAEPGGNAANVSVEDEQEEDKIVNLESEEGFIDLSDALKSKHFVRRAILNTAIKNTSRFHLGRPYINHLVGFNAILQRAPFTKVTTAAQALAAGYVLSFGLGIEGGLEFSTLSNAYIGTRYLFDSLSAFVWPFVGVGLSRTVDFLSVSDGNSEFAAYAGPTRGYFFNTGVMIPLVDLGLKAEMRVTLYGSERIMLTSGIGAVLFF